MGAAYGQTAPLRVAVVFTVAALALSAAAALSPSWVSWQGETLGLWQHCPGGGAPCTSPPCSGDVGAAGTCVARDAACACALVTCSASFCALVLGARALRVAGGRGAGRPPTWTARAFPAMLALSCVLVAGEVTSFLCYLLATVRVLHLGWGSYSAFSALLCWALAAATSAASACGRGGPRVGNSRSTKRGRNADDPSVSTTTVNTTTTTASYNSASSATIFAPESAWRPAPDMQLVVKLPRLRVQQQQQPQQPQQQQQPQQGNAVKSYRDDGGGEDNGGAGDYDIDEGNVYEHADWPRHHTSTPTVTSTRADLTLTRADLTRADLASIRACRSLPALPPPPGCVRGPCARGVEGVPGPPSRGPEGWVYENLYGDPDYGDLDYGDPACPRPQGPPVRQRTEAQGWGTAHGGTAGDDLGLANDTYNMYY
ncbi:unnamed protein product [Lampetra fluviatilis]